MSSNPVIAGSLSLVAGNLLGASIDNLMTLLMERANLTKELPLTESTKRIADDIISIILHVGLLGLGTHFVSNAFPWMSEQPASFTLWIMGITMTSNNLKRSLRDLNNVLLGWTSNSEY
jgi:hypothetical protein